MINRTEESKLYKVLKVKIKDSYYRRKIKVSLNAIFNESWKIERIPKCYKYEQTKKFIIDVNLSEKFKLKKKYTLVKESEVIRIIRCLELDRNNKLDYGFVAIEDIISMDISTKIYNENKFGIIYLRKFIKDKDGKVNAVSETKYKRLLASTGGIRSNRVTFIREELFDKANEILLCGMPNDMEFEFFSKYSAYFSLANTDSTPVPMPRIIVVKDFALDICETFDVVTETLVKGNFRVSSTTGEFMVDKATGEFKRKKDRLEYDAKTIKNYTEKDVKPFDGAGLVDIEFAKKISKELRLDYTPSSYQFRCIPGIKGNLYPVDLQEFAARYPDKKIIVDAWGKDVELYDENGEFAIDVVLTVSQFKFFKEYDSFNAWLDAFNKELYGYKRTFNIAHVGDKYGKLKDKTLISYQPLQSLRLEEDQRKLLCQDTIDTIKDISTNVDSFLKFRGFNENDDQIPDYYKALAVNSELFYDPWMQGKIRKDIEGFKERTYRGSLYLPSNYQTLIPDIFGLCLFAFGEEPVGLLKKDEAYSNYWFHKGEEKIGIVRFPHIANEWGIVNIVNPKSNDKMDFYKYITTGIITSMYSTLPLKLNSADFDGDKVLGISGNSAKFLIDEVKSQMANTITFIPKDKPVVVDENGEVIKPTFHKINEMSELISTDIKGMSNNIGNVVNKISILWSMPQNELRDKYIKIMSIIGSLTIDYVKSGEKTPIPKEVLEYIKDEKLPEFMRTRYKSKDKKDRRNNETRISLGKEEIVAFNQNPCTMNSICEHMHNEVDDIKLEKDEPNFDFITSMIDKGINQYNGFYNKVLDLLIELKKESDDIAKLNINDENGDWDQEKNTEKNYMYLTFYEYCKYELLKLCTKASKMDKNKLIDCLIYAFFCDKSFALKHQDKAILWNCFGKELTTRFKEKSRKTECYTDEKIEKLAEKANALQATKEKQKKDRVKKNKEHAKITMLEGDKEVKIYKAEMVKIKEIVKEPEEVKLAVGLLVLDRFCKVYKKSFEIHISKRNTINKNQLVVLTGIDERKYEKLRRNLADNGMIELNPKIKDDHGVLICKVNVEASEGDSIKLKNINGIKGILKNINNLNKIFKNIA